MPKEKLSCAREKTHIGRAKSAPCHSENEILHEKPVVVFDSAVNQEIELRFWEACVGSWKSLFDVRLTRQTDGTCAVLSKQNIRCFEIAVKVCPRTALISGAREESHGSQCHLQHDHGISARA